MSITRAQIARQLLAEGGVSLNDAKMMAPPGEFLAYINPKEADMLRNAGGSGIMTAAGIPSFVEYGDISGATASQDQVDSFSGGDSGSNIVDEVALTGRPPIDTLVEDQEEDNVRMMQALGIPPGLAYSGGNNIINRRGPVRNVGDAAINFGLYKLAKNNPKAFALMQTGKTLKGIYDFFKEPDVSPLNLSSIEERELAVLETGKEVGLNSPAQNKRLEELQQKKAEEEQK